MPFEEDKDPVERINEEYHERVDNPKPDIQKDFTIGESSIDKEQKKLETINKLIDARINPLKELTLENSQKIDGIIGELQKIGSYLQNANAPQVAPQPDAKGLLQQLPPEMAASVLNGMLGGLAQLVAAWKSGGHAEPNQFAQMSQEITTNLLRAGVDGIMQNVYHNYNPNPPKPSWQNPNPPQTSQHTLE